MDNSDGAVEKLPSHLAYLKNDNPTTMENPEDKKPSFAEIGESRKEVGILREFISFLQHNKKWWLLPIIIIIFLFAAIMVFSGGAAAPFIYTLF